MLDALAARGVDVSACRVAPGRPTGASVILGNGTDRAILTARGHDRATSGRPTSRRRCSARARHVHVGSYFLQPGLAAELPALFRAARAAGATTSLDPNWDPSGAWDGGFARGGRRGATCCSRTPRSAVALAGVDDVEAAARALASVAGASGRDGRREVRRGRRARGRPGRRRRRAPRRSRSTPSTRPAPATRSTPGSSPRGSTAGRSTRRSGSRSPAGRCRRARPAARTASRPAPRRRRPCAPRAGPT